jgi:hypothetical protein
MVRVHTQVIEYGLQFVVELLLRHLIGRLNLILPSFSNVMRLSRIGRRYLHLDARHDFFVLSFEIVLDFDFRIFFYPSRRITSAPVHFYRHPSAATRLTRSSPFGGRHQGPRLCRH